jgi:primosomal protein N' (replication factor Y)
VIAKVEPLTPARSLRGPFDYLLAGALEDVGVGSMLVVPFGRRRLLGVVVDVAADSDLPPERLAEPIAALEADVPQSLVALGLWVAREYVSTPARGLALVLPPGTGTGAGRPLRPKRSLRATITPAGETALAEGTRMGARQWAALEAAAAAPLGAAALARRTGCTHSTLRSLERRGLIRLESTADPLRRSVVQQVGARAGTVELTDDQRAAFETIEARLAAPEPGAPLLLHGVTGSGKTEVYLRSVAATLERGRSAIVLVPEIALTPQTAGRFVERFGDQVAVMHSRLSPRERYDEWWRMRRGEARVCVGPRSAVFAPFDDLGLIIVDEEHDGSYKQEGDPRYDARAVAERRAADEGAMFLAGSATPRPESMLRCERIRLPSRVDGRELPPVELVAMVGTAGPLHERTRQALDEVRRREEKAIVLLNRRGWSNFLSCRSCARVWECPNCDVTLVLHRSLDEVACHHCGHREPAPSVCPDCGSVSVARHGAGTEQLERELEELVAPLPDFRAEERTFALVAQLAGRSGRGERGGRVIVQALDPSAEALRFAARHDAEGFLEAELRRRELLSYPPHGHLIRVVCSATEPGPELEAATAIRALVTSAGVPALGPAPMFRRQARHRAQLVIRSQQRAEAISAVRDAVEHVAAQREHAAASFAVDVDPQ